MPHVKYMFDNDNIVIKNTYVDIVPRKEEIIRFENVYVPVVIITHCALSGETHVILDEHAICCVANIETPTIKHTTGDILTKQQLVDYVKYLQDNRNE